MMNEDTLVYIWSNEHEAYWAPNCRGYATCRSEAGVYRLKEAVEICQGANRHLDGIKMPNETIQPIPNEDVIVVERESVLK